ncbi:hypothetical protein ACSNOH_34315, partial [Streptomyces sp. URMC 127]
MSNQPHHTYDPREPYDSYDAYDARTQRHDAQSYGQAYGQQQQDGAYGSYGDGYNAYDPYAQQQPQAQQQHHQQHQQSQPQQQAQPQQFQWPTNGGQGFHAHDEPVTQTWQTPTWDTGTWQQPAPPAEDHSYGTSWSAGTPLPEERPAGRAGSCTG